MASMVPSDPAVQTPRDPTLATTTPARYPTRDGGHRPPIAVGPGRPGSIGQGVGSGRDLVNGYPIQFAKVQPPPLRDETLARDRLLDWLHAKIHSRVILILADAGYGKTTLLADFARRTRLRTLWYRLDDDDLDWTSLLHHLIAAGREHDPSFAPATVSMLGETGIGGPSREAVMDVFIRELPTIATTGAILILDDFHLVDEAQDARFVARELVLRAPERLSIVFASRRGPSIPLARLRANGEVADLGTDDLRFDVGETARLFTETYGRTLDPDVLEDVARRTEGWAASLQLVQAALRDRTPAEIRRFVKSLSGADQELYDYLAEEVVGDLPDDLQRFLMQTSLLQAVTPELAEVVTGLDGADVTRLTIAAERLTLLGRRAGGPRTQLRYHPLVREFLESRLGRDVGLGGVRTLHELVGRYAEADDWRTAAHHYWMAEDRQRVYQVIDGAAQDIVAKGEYSLTETYLPDPAEGTELASFEVLRSRRDFKHGDVTGALFHANRAVALDPDSSIALVNLASLAYNIGEFDLSIEMSRRLAATTSDSGLRAIAEGLEALVDTSLDGDLRTAIEVFTSLAARQEKAGEHHFAGVTYLNLANLLRISGRPEQAIDCSVRATQLLESSSNGSEVSAALVARGWSVVQLEDIDGARVLVADAIRRCPPSLRWELIIEAADMEVTYGSARRAVDYLSQLGDVGASTPWGHVTIAATRAQWAIRIGDLDQARRLLSDADITTPSSSSAHKARLMALAAHLAVAEGDRDARLAVVAGLEQATRQHAGLWIPLCRLLLAVETGTDELRRFVRLAGRDEKAAISSAAELFVPRLSMLEDEEAKVVAEEAARLPERWRDPLRTELDQPGRTNIAAAHLLDAIGTKDDIPRLRAVAKSMRGRPESSLGRTLARRVAARAIVEDQGRVSVRVGDRSMDGSAIRRKVLGLLCFLVSRPGFSAARDEALEALWPDFDPGDALNSLNQTVYFLRRVFEPEYREDLSPGYLNHEGDLIWLDPELLESRSHLCWNAIKRLASNPPAEDVAELANMYRGPFALDFAYEDWATAYRSNLQSAFLQVVEQSVHSDIASGHFERGIVVARQAIESCPDADNIELSLLRLYKLNGSHAAAAEQYAHYSTWIRDTLGIEPPSLDSL